MNFAVTSVFETTNWKVGSGAYQVTLLSERGGPVATLLGYEIQTSSFKPRTFDNLIIAGSIAAPAATPGLLSYLRSAVDRTARIASVCTGALVLAEAGLLDGRRATTHWQFARNMQRRYPKIAVEEDRIFIIDGPIWTSAGLSARIAPAQASGEKGSRAEDRAAVAQKPGVLSRPAPGSVPSTAFVDT